MKAEIELEVFDAEAALASMRRAGYTPLGLAAECGFSARALGAWLAGIHAPRESNVRHMARVLGIAPDSLWRAAPSP